MHLKLRYHYWTLQGPAAGGKDPANEKSAPSAGGTKLQVITGRSGQSSECGFAGCRLRVVAQLGSFRRVRPCQIVQSPCDGREGDADSGT
jgi:hypothetical protein